jgi:hypothetical protein
VGLTAIRATRRSFSEIYIDFWEILLYSNYMKCKTKWPLEKLIIEALKYSTRGEFAKHSPGAYQAAWAMGILDKICGHMKIIKNAWPIEELRAEALKYNTRGDFQKYSSNAYNIALKRGLLDQICGHMEVARYDWTNEELALEALKYSTRSEFEKNNRKAYDVAMKRGILDQICSHMIYLTRQWTDKELHEEALKYKTRSEFKYANASAYAIARKRGILDKICSHMKPSRGSSAPEKELLAILKKYFPNLINKTFSVSVPNKPHLHRFQVDILNPETKLGIEYDGPYHHSEAYLIKKKTQLGWPVEDAINYHPIKDSALWNCHGIKLIHVKGDDWKDNKQACIDKCLAFLGVEQKKVA